MQRVDLWKRPWCWEGLGMGGEGDDRGWDGSWHHWPDGHEWVNSRSWWWTGRPGVPWFMGSQRVGHDWVTELNWTDSSEILDLYLDFVKLTVLKSLLNLLQYCFCCSYVLGTSFCSLFLAKTLVGSQFSNQGSHLLPMHWKAGLTLDGLGSPYSFLRAYEISGCPGQCLT